MSYEFFFDLSKSPRREVLFRFYFLKIICFLVVFCSFRMFYEILLVSVLKMCALPRSVVPQAQTRIPIGYLRACTWG